MLKGEDMRWSEMYDMRYAIPDRTFSCQGRGRLAKGQEGKAKKDKGASRGADDLIWIQDASEIKELKESGEQRRQAI
ncbi:hypothetical protein E4U13_001216 [Claviceps humidiphila]|uniref:Uncharacterized protein n=2 Tax=Claviceps TaxID=5110 RepID=A0A9P7SNZ7_9HYPO|nr:hypothetical protein E4U57_001060 [Claviceps arundinis]KAG5967569.1 hypothetical protein E4U56_000731 [Claviceps arundinis]KAG6061588.1 hypothetical protein E4U32_002871 [Claviceps aff. humidiphila group G2b]KAG6117291.1 hypothetical protein E4U13_001216 [Claviceps humidiphila]